MVKLEQYRVFHAVATHGSFSRAAQALFMTQSAVSQAIKNLELALSVRLFLRGTRETSLTAEGRVLFEYVASALELFETAEEKLLRLKGLELGELRIGVGDTISRYFLLPALERFHEEYPNIKLKIFNRVSRDTVSLLQAGKIDLAFVNLPIGDDTLVVRHSKAVHDIFVGGAKFEDLRGQAFSPQEIAELPLILLEEASNSRRSVDEFFRAQSVHIHPEIELGSHDLLLEFAKSNLGISCVIREFSEDYLQNGSVFELKLRSPIPPRRVAACTLSAASESIATEKFLALLG